MADPATPDAKSNPRKSIWQELEDWADTLKSWQRYAVLQLIRHGKLPPELSNDVFNLYLFEYGLSENKAPALAAPMPSAGRAAGDTKLPINLIALRNLNNVNAIPPSSELRFGDQLTVIYGNNGTGKSGFARVLANCCFSRHQPKILPNVYSIDPPGPPVAEIVLREGNSQERCIAWTAGTDTPELRRIAMFDASVARIHLNTETPMSFKPIGFDIFQN